MVYLPYKQSFRRFPACLTQSGREPVCSHKPHSNVRFFYFIEPGCQRVFPKDRLFTH